MIAVAIVALLVAIAVPSYQSYRYRVLVGIAKLDITNLGLTLSRFEMNNNGFPDSLAAIGKDGMLDPWNNPYQYLNLTPLDQKLKSKVRKEKNLHPINSDYDLYSMGQDGKSQAPLTAAASRDDIVRASDGRFVGLASDY